MDGLTISNASKFLETSGLKSSSTSSASSNLGADQVQTLDKSKQKSFAETLNEVVASVNTLQVDSDRKVQELATGQTDDVAAVMIASEKADIALRAMVQVRNKIIDAYQEIMKMQV